MAVVPRSYRGRATPDFPDPLRRVGIRETLTIDEASRLELAEAAKRALGERAGVTLMELLPPVGWADVATKHDLAELDARIDLRFAAAERHLDTKLEGLRHELLDAFHRDQIALTWRYLGVTGSMFLAFSALVTLVVRL